MAVSDRNVAADAKFALAPVSLPCIIASAVSQSDLKVRGVTPGYAFEVERVEVFAKTVTATLTVDVKIGSTTVLASAITPVADTPTAGTLSTTITSLRGSSTDILNLHYTTNGSGAFTGMTVVVWIRPAFMKGDSQTV